jgi:hypothetical protein
MTASLPSRQLRDQLVAFAWDEWAQMGLLATPRRRSPWAQDPEALIIFTLEVARAEPRLFDELLDWMLLNEPLLSVRRLRAMCIDEVDRPLTAATLAWLANQRPRARLGAGTERAGPLTLQPLFQSQIRAGESDQAFASAGWLRSPLSPSHKSRPPDLMAPTNLAFRLRQILGVGVRAEAIRVLLTNRAPWMNAQALARSTGYAKRNVHDALSGLSAAGVVTAFIVGGEQRYAADLRAWAALLGSEPGELPAHRDWPQLLAVLRRVLRWLEQQELAAVSEYLRSSMARDLLELVRGDLAFAGIPTPGSSPDSAWGSLEEVLEETLVIIGVDARVQQ